MQFRCHRLENRRYHQKFSLQSRRSTLRSQRGWKKQGEGEDIARLIVYGDIHGCQEELRTLREKLGACSEDREICVGDMIGKGPYSLQTLRYIQQEGILAIRGNHEDKFIRYHLHEQERMRKGVENPMHLDELESAIYASLDHEDFVYLQSLPLFIRIGRVCVVHGGVLPKTDLFHLDKKEAAKVMRVRYLDDEGNFVSLQKSDPSIHFWWSDLYDGRYGYIVYGHQPFLIPRIDRFCFGIDTGAVYGNELTAIVFPFEKEVEVESFTLWSVTSRAYAPRKKPWILPNL